MDSKKQILATLMNEYNAWEALLGGLSEAQITAPNRIAQLSVKDILAHLWAWQQRSIVRMEAAQKDQAPVFPRWSADLDPEDEEDTDRINAWIYQAYRDRPWAEVHKAWKEGFLAFVASGEAIPEKDLMKPGRYAWLGEYPLSAVLVGSYEHHEEHLQPLLQLFGKDR